MQALVIDDARVMRAILRGTLQQLGFEVSEASTGREGLDRLRDRRPDVVLVDCYMPEMDGFEFLRQVRDDRSLTGLPVLMVTGEDDAALTSRALAEGADDFVVKPFTRETLCVKLRSLGFAHTGT